MGFFDKLPSEKEEAKASGKEETLILDESEKIRRAFIEAKGEAGKQYLKDLSSRDWYKRHITARAFGRWLNPENAPILIPLLKDKSENIRDGVAETLEEIGSPATEPLITLALLDTESPLSRHQTARILGSIKDMRAVEPLIVVLTADNVEDVRRTAAWALGEIKDERAVQPLIQALKEDKSEIVRRVAAWALGEIQDLRAVEPLVQVLREGSDTVRIAAIEALGEIGDSVVIEPLTQALNDRSKEVQKAAKVVLEKMKKIKKFHSTLR